MIAINQLQEYQTQIRDRISALIRAADQARTDIASMTSHITHLAVLNVASNMVALLEGYEQRAMAFDQEYLHAKDQAEVGVLTEMLAEKELVGSLLKEMRSPLQAEDLYGRLKVTLLSVKNDSVAYTFSIPRMDPERLTAWRIVSAPYQTSVDMAWITPELSAMAVSASTGDLIATQDCQGEETKWCRSPIHMKTPPCVQGILSHAPDLLERCLVQPAKVRIPYILRVNHHQLLISTRRARIDERCSPDATTQILEAGQYLLTPSAGCTLAGPPGWTFHAGTAARLSIQLLDAYVLPSDLNVNMSTQNLVGTTPDPPAGIAELPEFSGRRLQTPSWGRHPPWFHVTGAYAAWLWTSIAAVVIVACAAVWWYRRRNPRDRLMVPTTDAEEGKTAPPRTTTPPPAEPKKDGSPLPLFTPEMTPTQEPRKTLKKLCRHRFCDSRTMCCAYAHL